MSSVLDGSSVVGGTLRGRVPLSNLLWHGVPSWCCVLLTPPSLLICLLGVFFPAPDLMARDPFLRWARDPPQVGGWSLS